MHPHVPDSSAANNAPQRAAQQPSRAVSPGQGATGVTADTDTDSLDSATLRDEEVTQRPLVARHVTPLGGPAHEWHVYYDIGPTAEELAKRVSELCPGRGVYCVVKTVDDYRDSSELKFVQGVVFVFSSEPASKNRKMKKFKEIEDDFRHERPTTAVQGYVKDPSLSRLVGVLQVLYTDHALEDKTAQGILLRACATHPYTPGNPFEGNLFEVFEPGKAELVKMKDEMVSSNAEMWRQFRRWGVRDMDQAWAIRTGFEREVLRCEDRDKKALYRPIKDVQRNQLWLALNDPEHRPPADPDATPEENAKAARLFVANSARAVRDALANLKAEFGWFDPPTEATRRGATDKVATFYQTLRSATGHS